MQPEVEYLGFKINKQGPSLLKEKTKTMQSTSKLKNISELKSFLGLINYYHRHFKNFVSLLEPLHKLLREDVQLKWRHDQDNALRKAKEMLSDLNLLLVHYDKNKSLVLACDAYPTV